MITCCHHAPRTEGAEQAADQKRHRPRSWRIAKLRRHRRRRALIDVGLFHIWNGAADTLKRGNGTIAMPIRRPTA